MDTTSIKQEATNVKLEDYENNSNNIENAKEKDNTSLENSRLNGSNTKMQSCWYCKTQFLSTGWYITHLKQAHQPNPKNPKFYCKPCNVKHKSLEDFHSHLRIGHKMELPPLKSKPSPTTDDSNPNDKSFYCKSCGYRYQRLGVYRKHLRRKHKMTLQPLIARPDRNIEPDPNDPNFYCKSCCFTYKDRDNFRAHIRGVHLPRTHRLKLPSYTRPKPKFRCKICNIAYGLRVRFHSHLRKEHGLNSEYVEVVPNSKLEPDPNDPNLYCKPYEIKHITKTSYWNHLRCEHGINMQHKNSAEIQIIRSEPSDCKL